MQQEALGLSPTRAKAINRALIEAELITMKDSPHGKRYGMRRAAEPDAPRRWGRGGDCASGVSRRA
jgi:hypothetical protein